MFDLLITGEDKAYIVFGGALSGNIALQSLTPAAGRVVQVGGLFGMGDINNDGFDDLGAQVAVGSPQLSEGTNLIYRQAVEIYLGGARLTTTYAAADLLIEPAQAYFFQLGGISRISDALRLNLFASVGDINGDGFADFVQADRFGGASHVILGRALTTPVPPLPTVRPASQEFIFELATPLLAQTATSVTGITLPVSTTDPLPVSGSFGVQGILESEGLSAIILAGDVNNDGFDDFIITGSNTARYAYLIFGPVKQKRP